MLRRSLHTHCLECGKPYGDPAFASFQGRVEAGPAFWSDRGLLCSPACCVAHHQKRLAEGDPMTAPVENPVEHLLHLRA